MFNIIQFIEKKLDAIGVFNTNSNIVPLVLNSIWILICNPYSRNETSNVSPKQVTSKQDIADFSHNRIMPRHYLFERLPKRHLLT
jgi:hypothetical protein